MSKIAIIDDNTSQSNTLCKNILMYLSQNSLEFNVITQFPFQTFEEYFDFIDNNDICAIILDEQLNNRSNNINEKVDYLGTNLVIELRKRLPDFPIFSFTTYRATEDLENKAGEFEYTINRKSFYKDKSLRDSFIKRMVRSAHRYIESHKKDLEKYDALTEKIINGDYNQEDEKQLKFLQMKLELPISTFNDRQKWLDEYEKHIMELKQFMDDIENSINQSSKNNRKK